MNILLDLDGTISYAPGFFKKFTEQFYQIAEIHIVTCRREEDREDTEKELQEYGIKYHKLAITPYKVVYARENDIDIVFEDDDEFFKLMPKEITVFKIREEHNWDWKRRKWLYDDNTGVHREDL